MFHELWIGEALQSSLKHKILGKLQQHILKDLLRRLKPAVVHTHTPLYIYLLSKLGCSAIKLPLFGNVPLQADTTNSMVLKALDIPASDRHRWSIFTIFGSIHPEWNGEDFLERAKSTIRASGKQPAFVAVGRLGSIGEEIWKRMEARQDFSCKWLSLGEQPVEVISQCLLASDFGVSSVPPEYLFKSGTAIAMLEHGLPVITTRPVGRYSNCPESVLQERLPNNFRHLDFGKMSKLTPRELLPEIAGQFVRDLDLAGEKKGATA